MKKKPVNYCQNGGMNSIETEELQTRDKAQGLFC